VLSSAPTTMATTLLSGLRMFLDRKINGKPELMNEYQ
jgi:hypothetical protein